MRRRRRLRAPREGAATASASPSCPSPSAPVPVSSSVSVRASADHIEAADGAGLLIQNPRLEGHLLAKPMTMLPPTSKADSSSIVFRCSRKFRKRTLVRGGAWMALQSVAVG